MASDVVMINGLPGVGKTATGVCLAEHLGVPLLSKDVFKEQLADGSARGLTPARLGAVASETMWSQAAVLGGLVVVESWWYRRRDTVHATSGLRASGADRA
ncbi:MAG TPA: hypothetical protein VF477_16135, partial [Mycobacterium sp.]